MEQLVKLTLIGLARGDVIISAELQKLNWSRMISLGSAVGVHLFKMSPVETTDVTHTVKLYDG